MSTEHSPRQKLRGGPVTKTTIVEGIRNGESEAWEEFFAVYWRWLLGICHNMGIPHADAEDLVQKVFIKVNQHIQEFVYDPSRGRFSGWLVVILGNLAIGYWRKGSHDLLKQAGHGARGSGSQTAPLYRVPGPRKDQVVNQVMANELQRMFKEAYAELKVQVSPQHWAVFKAYAMEDRPVKEVAAEFGLAPGSVYSIVSRLTETLREIITCKLKL